MCSNGQGNSPQPTIAENDTIEQNGASDAVKATKAIQQQEENGETGLSNKKTAHVTFEDEITVNHTNETSETAIAKGEHHEHINNKTDIQSITKAGE